MFGSETEIFYREMGCKCGAEFTVKSTIVRGFKDNEEVYCPKCKEFVVNIRADVGFEIQDVK